MNTKHVAARFVLLLLIAGGVIARASDGRVEIFHDGTSSWLRVDGDRDDDWWVEASADLVTWEALDTRPWLSGNVTNAPFRLLSQPEGGPWFFRARQTAGLYDPSIFRTLSLTFTQANWQSLLANARTTGTNILCSLVTLDNGATNVQVGARYKGNSSYQMSGTKKSINLEFDFAVTNADLMSYETVNLNNAAGDETIMREALYFNVMSQYTPCPQGSMVQVRINGALWGVYSLVEQENAQLVRAWFPSDTGDRWRAPNAAAGGGTGGMFTSSNSAFSWFGTTNIASYRAHYELKSQNTATNIAWERLIQAIRVLHTTPTNQLRDEVENVFAVDNWLWFLAIENLFVDDDSYWYKGADYGFYYEPESGRIHPIEHDGNEAFYTASGINYALSPVTGATGNNRPLLYRWLPINELRQRYLAHMRTVLQEYFNPAVMTPMIDAYHRLSIQAIIADPNKGFTMTAYTNELNALKTYVTNRYNFLTKHAELLPEQPVIVTVTGPSDPVTARDTGGVTAQVVSGGSSGVGSVWLYHRGRSYGKFTRVQMFDDGLHGDGVAGDQLFGAATTNYPAGTKVRYYVEARATNAAQAASFSPARAEHQTHSYRVAVTSAASSPVVINEVMADNLSTLADDQGEFDDWLELKNVSGEEVDLTGRYLSDEPNNPRKWRFPDGTRIPADGYLLVWADEDSTSITGLHASFRLSASGESLFLTDTDANLNAILDAVTFGSLGTDISYGRSGSDADVWTLLSPTPGTENRP